MIKDIKNALKIGVFGSALGDHTKDEMGKAFLLGEAVAENDCVLVTGATFGLPNEAIKGAHSKDGFTLGISPACTKTEHEKEYGLPVDDDLIVYTGLGYDGRNMINIRSSDGAVFIKGSIGTLNEFTVAVKEEKVIGILEDVDGVSGKLREILDVMKLNFNPKIVYDKEPKSLIKKVVEELKK